MHLVNSAKATQTALLVVAVFGLIAISLMAMRPSRSATIDPLTDEYAANLGIEFDGPNAVDGAAVVVSVAKATRIAQDYFGTDELPVGVRHGRAAQFADSPIRSVWIVTFAGGNSMPNVGPSRVPDKPSEVTGVVVDDETGEVLFGFGVGPPLE
jgi:hypothetical protein